MVLQKICVQFAPCIHCTVLSDVLPAHPHGSVMTMYVTLILYMLVSVRDRPCACLKKNLGLLTA